MFLRVIKRIFSRFNSAVYWQRRYAEGRTSGSGSFGRLADYKAHFINDFVSERAVSTIIEFGFGDGAQASKFEFSNYTGVDVVPMLVERASIRFEARADWRFLTTEAYAKAPFKAELAMSLDVIYHLVEDRVFDRYMRMLFDASSRFVLIYSSDDPSLPGAKHVRHRRYCDWVTENRPQFAFSASFKNPYAADANSDWNETSFAHFALYELRATRQ